jgi:hypothetical protein
MGCVWDTAAPVSDAPQIDVCSPFDAHATGRPEEVPMSIETIAMVTDG